MNPAIKHLPVEQRRELLETERRYRQSEQWGEWKHIDLPNGIPDASGWTKQVRLIHKNRVFAVLERPVTGAIHLAVSSLSGKRPSWHEMQRIKDEIAGRDATAVEVYPPHNEIVDGADMFHIWVVSALPFSLHRD